MRFERSGWRNVRLTLGYDGSGFLGFQRQRTGRSVQGTLEIALSALAGEPVRVTGAGRTDAGVHARGQVVNCLLPLFLPTEYLAGAANRMLPPDLRVMGAEDVDVCFHARYAALWRVYEYTLLQRTEPAAMEWRFVWQTRVSLDLEGMSEAATLMRGVQDFGAFGTPELGRSPLREMSGVQVRREGDYVKIVCRANAFLRHMARGVVGGLVDVGTGRRAVEDVRTALQTGRAVPAFTVAPPNGLCLVAVEY